jgi:hypothetical protein
MPRKRNTNTGNFPTKKGRHCNAHGLCRHCMIKKEKRFGVFVCPNDDCSGKKSNR